MPSAQKIFLTSFIFVLFLLIPSKILAAIPWNAENQSNFTLITLEHGLLCELAGTSPLDKCTGYEGFGKDKKLVLYNQPGGGAIGGLSTTIGALYNPPTSTVQYLADAAQGFGLIKPAYAQVGGSGTGIVEPVRQLWQAVRNLAYVLFIVIFIVVGFMIMFRQKINPQTVISAQAALPGLIVGLILVTFSYLISSLLIDVAFVGVQLVARLFVQSGMGNVFDAQNLAKDSNIFQLFTSSIRFGENFGDITGGLFRTLGNNVPSAVVIPAFVGLLVGLLLLPFSAGTSLILGGLLGAGSTAVIGLIVPLILIIALVIQFFKLLFKLITAYISLLVSTIASPLIILYASIPGRGGSLNLWWKTLLANALIFPAVFAAFLFAGLILATDPKLWKATPPLFGGMSTELVRLIIAYGIILGTPAVPDMVKNALGVKDIAGIPQAAQSGAMLGGQAGWQIGSRGYARLWRGDYKGNVPTGPIARGLRKMGWIPGVEEEKQKVS